MFGLPFWKWFARMVFPGVLLFTILHFRTRSTRDLFDQKSFPQRIEIQIEVQGISTSMDRYNWYYLRGTLINYPTPQRSSKPMRISLRCKKPFTSIQVGKQYKIVCTLRASPKYFAVATISSPSKLILINSPPRKLNAKEQIIHWIRKQTLPLGSSYGLVLSLLCGDRTELPIFLRQQFLQTGTVHLLAVSGVHLGMVWGGCTKLLGYFVSLETHRIAALLLCGLYAYVNSFRPPIMRAYFMLVIGTGLFFLDKGSQLLHLVLFCGMALLVWDPTLANEMSFQLSFAGTIGIAIGMQACLNNPKWALWQKGLWISFFAQMWTVPLEIYYFGKVHPLAFVNSCIISPFIFLFLGCGFCTMLVPNWITQWGLQTIVEVLLQILQKIFDVLLMIPQEIPAHEGLQNKFYCIGLFGGILLWSSWIWTKMLQQSSKTPDFLK